MCQVFLVYMATFSENIKALRKFLGITQDEFAIKIDVHRVTLAKFEQGELKPAFDTLEKICGAFKVNIGWLVSGDGDMFEGHKNQRDIEEIVSYLNQHPIEKKIVLEVVHTAKNHKEALENLKRLHQPKLKQKPA